MKKVIRLTESDIHRIVKNSVKKVLTELDWKTYQNAASKIRQRELDNGNAFVDDETIYDDENMYDRIENLHNAAKDAFERKHNLPSGKYLDFHHIDDSPYLNGCNHPDDDSYNGEDWGENYESFKNSNFPQSAKDDLYNYKHGKSKYTKGKGWE